MKRQFLFLCTLYFLLAVVAHAQYPIRNYIMLQDNTTHLYGASGGFVVKQLLPNGSGTRFTSFAAYRDSSIFYVAGEEKFRMGGSAVTASDDILPGASASYDIGATGARWRDLWLSRNATVDNSLTVGAFAGTAGQLSLKGNLHIEASGNTNQLRLLHDGTNAFVNASSGELRMQLAGSSYLLMNTAYSRFNNQLYVTDGTENSGLRFSRQFVSNNSSSRIFHKESANDGSGFSWIYAGDPNPTLDGVVFTLGANAYYLIRHNGSSTGANVLSFTRDAGLMTVFGEQVNQQRISVTGGSTSSSAGLHMSYDANAARNHTDGHAVYMIDANNDQTDRSFFWRHDNLSSNLMSLSEDGLLTVAGDVTLAGAAGVARVLLVDQPSNNASSLSFRSSGSDALRWNIAKMNSSFGVPHALVFGYGTASIDQNVMMRLSPAGDLLTVGDLQIQGGDLTTNQSAFNLLDNTVQTLNFSRAATAVTMGATTGTTTLRHDLAGAGGKRWYNNYTSGVLGSGFAIDHDLSVANRSWLEVDEMRVRGSLRAHIFQKDIVRAINGHVFVGAGATTVTSSFTVPAISGTVNVTVKDAVLYNGDIIWVKDIFEEGTSLAVNSTYFKVSNSDPDANITLTTLSGDVGHTIKADATLNVVGNDGTTADRDGALFFTAADANSPYMDIYTGRTSDATVTPIMRFGKLTGITDADFGGTLPATYGAYINGSAFIKGNMVVKAAQALALQNAAIMIGNITGTANNAIKLTNTGTASTSGLFGYNNGGVEVFKLGLDNVHRLASAYFSATDIWAGNSSIGNINTELVFGDLQSGEPKLALGSTADNITIAGTEPGVMMDGSGQFKAYTNASNYIRKTTSALDIAASAFNLATSTLVLESVTPKFALGASASSISLTAGEGILGNGSGDFKAGTGDLDATPTGTGIAYVAGSDLFQAVSNGTVMFSVDATTARLVSMYASGDDVWAGNASLSNLNTTFALEGLNTTTPTLALGPGAGSINHTIATGIFMDGTGNFRAGAGTPVHSGIIFTASSGVTEIKANSNVILSASSSGGTIAGWTATNTAFTSGSGAGFTGMQSGTGTTKTFFSGATATDGTNANFYVQANGYVFADSGAIAGWDFDNTKLTKGTSTTGLALNTSSTPFLAAGGLGFEVWDVNAPKFVVGDKDGLRMSWNTDVASGLYLGGATAGWKVTASGLENTSSSSTMTGGLIRTAASGQRVEMAGADNKLSFYNANDELVSALYGNLTGSHQYLTIESGEGGVDGGIHFLTPIPGTSLIRYISGPQSSVYAVQTVYQDILVTSSNLEQTLFSVAMVNDRSVLVKAYIIGFADAGGEAYAYEALAVFIKDDAGNVTQVGSTILNVIGESNSTATANIAVNTTTSYKVTVTPASNSSTVWTCTVYEFPNNSNDGIR